ncbi:hypothetical protein GWC77_26515 [Paraburkholderia sp. NMBU_R16]|nr:hypothetical protein [Paraburkholderia sp. NMBU_R16]
MLIAAFASALPVAAVPEIEIVEALLALPLPPPQPANNATNAHSSSAVTEQMGCGCAVLIEVSRWIVCCLNDPAGASIPSLAKSRTLQTYCEMVGTSEVRLRVRSILASGAARLHFTRLE